MTHPSLGGIARPRVIANSLFKELRTAGFSTTEVLAVSSHLIGLLTENLRDGSASQTTADDAPTETGADGHTEERT